MSKSIKLENDTYIDSSGVSYERTLLSTIIAELKQLVPMSEMTIQPNTNENQNITIGATWTYYKVPLNEVRSYTGDWFTYGDCSIICNKACKALVSGAITVSLGTNQRIVRIYVKRASNGKKEIITTSYSEAGATTRHVTIPVLPRTIDLNVGDEVYMTMAFGTAGTTSLAGREFTNFMVQAIAKK